MYDAIIVGAGPGGASAAYRLSMAGKKVLVIDKESLPRYKTCGGGVSLPMLGKYFPFSFAPVIIDEVTTIAYTLQGLKMEVSIPPHLLGMVMRDQFDAFILSHARADIRPQTAVKQVVERPDRVIVETGAGQFFEGQYLIGADGANSIVAKSLNLRRRKTLAGAIEVEVPAAPEVLNQFRQKALFIFGEITPGYAWVFPKNSHLSVGVASIHPRPGQLQSTLKKTMQRYGISLDGAPIHGHPIPLYLKRETIATRRCLLVGDAAGLVDPLSGEGIRLAIKSGSLAARLIISGQTDAYSRLVYRYIGAGQQLAGPLAALFYYLTPVCFIFGVFNPLASYAFMDLFSDQIGYPEVLLRTFGTLPVFLPTEALAALSRVFERPQVGQKIRSTVYNALR